MPGTGMERNVFGGGGGGVGGGDVFGDDAEASCLGLVDWKRLEGVLWRGLRHGRGARRLRVRMGWRASMAGRVTEGSAITPSRVEVARRFERQSTEECMIVYHNMVEREE